MDNVRITSDGTASGTKVFIGDKEIGGIVSIEIGDIRARGVVSAKLEFMAVELDIKADPIGGVMDVIIDGKVAYRPIASRDVIMLPGGGETEMRRPVLFHGEFASYTLDGRVTIYRGPQDE